MNNNNNVLLYQNVHVHVSIRVRLFPDNFLVVDGVSSFMLKHF